MEKAGAHLTLPLSLDPASLPLQAQHQPEKDIAMGRSERIMIQRKL
jgi:hypothetical protein